MSKYPYVVRIIGLLLLIVLASKPVIVRPDPGSATGWAVLVDNSASMRVKDPVERLSRVLKSAKELAGGSSRFGVFSFSDQVAPVEAGKIGELKPSGKLSDLSAGLQAALAKKQYRGAVVMTDGREVGKNDALAAAASLGAPLMLVGVGDRAQFKDVAVRAVQSPPFAFKNVSTSLSATLSVIGYPGSDVTVTLREGDRTLSIQKVRVETAEAEATVTFTWTPGSVGTKVLSVEASRFSGEATGANNQKEVTLDVGRDKFRVLYICGQPGPEYGFLRHQFKADPAVELVTFVILRNASNSVNISEGELSLIPFPTQDVLINQMATFDLIVFEEFAYQLYGLSPQLVYAIRDKVQQGGSFLLMGGSVVFGVGSPYGIPGVREMIPVEFGTSDVSVISDPTRLIAKASAHPVMRLDANAERNKQAWESLPELDGVTRLPRAKAGATVLAAANDRGRETPVLTVWKFGKGRVGALTARTTWRWSMQNGSASAPADAYERFWKNMVLWLTHSDEFKPVRVAADSKTARAGEKETLRVWVFDDYFKPISDADVRVQVTDPTGKTVDLKPYPETSGVFAAPFTPEATGNHTLQAWVTRAGKRFGSDRSTLRVTENLSEEEDLRPNFDLLKELARTTGGRFVAVDQFSPAVFDAFNAEISKGGGRKILLWNSPWFLAVLLALFIFEWAYRKKQGLP